ncbi:helix-turn-helix domain-containing protein [Actinoplanes sp. NPDC049548]|uniref:IclR family transcriptional regulator n=1 Tax=Actinoplanes sp. NPDC049548 TaxID=3155152 RepID=UPI00343E17D3
MASRLLRVLDAFSVARPELSLADISRTTGLPPATLYRLLRELTDHGAIQRTSTGRYAVGLRLWEIGSLAPAVSRLDEVAIPYMADLYEATHGTLHLAVPLGTEALCVAAISGHPPVQPALPTGARVPLESPGVGRVLLAYAPPDVLAEVFAGGGSPYRIRQELVEIRRRGVAVTSAGSRPFSAAAPLVGPQGAVLAAVSVAVRTFSDSPLLIRLVRNAALGISRELGTSTDVAVRSAASGSRR